LTEVKPISEGLLLQQVFKVHRGGVKVNVSNSWSWSRRFKSHPLRCKVTTMDKVVHAHRWLCH